MSQICSGHTVPQATLWRKAVSPARLLWQTKPTYCPQTKGEAVQSILVLRPEKVSVKCRKKMAQEDCSHSDRRQRKCAQRLWFANARQPARNSSKRSAKRSLRTGSARLKCLETGARQADQTVMEFCERLRDKNSTHLFELTAMQSNSTRVLNPKHLRTLLSSPATCPLFWDRPRTSPPYEAKLKLSSCSSSPAARLPANHLTGLKTPKHRPGHKIRCGVTWNANTPNVWTVPLTNFSGAFTFFTTRTMRFITCHKTFWS